MGSRAKEDEKNERIIRGLLKLPENRRCINCNSLGPQYVCTSFWTFVCTTCSGIHREFTHRVKSVSMAKFTSQEVAALQEGGNQRARDIYLKEWDSQRQSGPDGSNVERLRDFIKHVYVDRRYSGERSVGKPPSTKMGEKEDSHDNKRTDTYQGGSRSPPYEDTYEHRYGEMSSPGARGDNLRFSYDERRSPGYDQESRQYNDFRRSPARPEIVNDWRREDRFGNGWKGDGDPKLDSRSPERAKEVSSLPVVRPVREILGDNVVPLRIIEPPKATVSKVANGPAQTQRTASSSSLGSTNENPVEVKLDHTKSLIDFDADPEPPTAVTVPQVQQTTAPQSVTKRTDTTNDNNWASFDFAPQVQVSQAPPNANPLESVLSQLSVSSLPSHMSAVPGGSGVLTAAPVANTANSLNTSNPLTAITSAVPITSLSTFQPGGVLAVTTRQVSSMPVNSGQGSSVPQQQQPSLFPAPSGQSTARQYMTPLAGASGNQPQNLSLAPNMQPALGTPSTGSPPVVLSPTSTVTSDGVSQAGEIKSTGRKALPEDLFTTKYSSFPTPMPGWQFGPPRAMGYSYTMQYPVATALMPTFVQQPKPTNPFDVTQPAQVPVQAQVPTFPSVTSLHGALPNIPPSSGLQPTYSLGAPLGAWMPPQSSPYPAALPSQSLSYASTMPPRPFVVQQVPPSSMPLAGHQVMGGLGVEGAAFGAVHVDQQKAGSLSTPSAQQPFSSVGGNPFG